MKLFLTVYFMLSLSLCLAAPTWNSDTQRYEHKYEQHYDQHQSSVTTARKAASQRLVDMGVHDSYLQRESNAITEGCDIICANNNRKSYTASSSDSESLASSVGVGLVGYPSSESTGDNSMISSTSIKESNINRDIVAPNYPSRDSRYSSSIHSENVMRRTPSVYPDDDSSRISSSNHQQSVDHIQTIPIYVQTYPSKTLQYSRQQTVAQARVQQPTHVIYSPGDSSYYRARHEESSRDGQIYIPIVPTESSSRFYQSRLENDRQTEQAVYAPVASHDSRYSLSRQIEKEQTRQIPYTPVHVIPTESSSSRYSSNRHESETRNSQSAFPVPVIRPESRYSVNHLVDSESRSRHGSHAHSIVPTESSSRVMSSRQHESESHTSPIYRPSISGETSSSTRYSSARHQESQSQHRDGVLTPIVPQSSLSNQYSHSDISNQYGSSDSIIGHKGYRYPNNSLRDTSMTYDGTSSDLTQYMSESERLAKEQSRNLHTGGALRGTAIRHDSTTSRDSRFGGSGSTDGVAGGFSRVKSWENSSRWASGTEYDPDGKPKSYSMISTAESEQHNVNGKGTGYKAATTTVDDDGKVSTYSIHTP